MARKRGTDAALARMIRVVYRENRNRSVGRAQPDSARRRRRGIMETGRNAPCPCGSGKKYKQCCLKTLKPDRDSEWQRLGEVYGRLDERLRRFAERTLGRAGMEASYDEFLLWPDEAPDVEFLERQGPLFCSWSVFNWTYEPEEVDGLLRLPPGATPAEFFLEQEKGRLSDTEIKLIETISRRPFSFYEVIRCEPGRGFLLKDVLTADEIDVLERSASEVSREGDILFGRVATVGDISMLFGCSSYALPPEYKPSIIALRKWMRRGRRKVTAEMLNEYDAEIREAFLEMSEALFRLPSLCNTDGEPLIMQILHYEIDSPDRAFWGLPASAQRRARQSCGPWRSGMRKEVLPASRSPGPGKSAGSRRWTAPYSGSCSSRGRLSRSTVNSAARAERIRKEIETRLGPAARFKTAVIQSGEAIMKEVRDRASRPAAPAGEHEELVQNPEVRAKLAEMMAAHWEGWVDEKIPALGGKTHGRP